MFPRRKTGRDSEHGSILVMTALTLVVLLGITALAIDVGFWYDLRNRMQGAADVAARSAARAATSATGCSCGSPCTTLNNFAANAVARAGLSSADVTVHRAPTSGAFIGDC